MAKSEPRQEAPRRRRSPERSSVGVCTKYTLFFENFLLLIVGMTMTGLGTYILVVKEKGVHDFIDFILDPACDMCLAGCIILVMAFFGAIGSLRENTCFLKIYYVSLCLILLGEFVIAILAFVSYYVPEVKSTVFPSSTFEKAIVNYRDDPDMKNLIDTMQQDLGCCGIKDGSDGFLDWNENIYFNCSEANTSPERCSVPFSCCIRQKNSQINYQCGANMMKLLPDGTVTGNDLITHLIYNDGCIKALGDWINNHALIVGGVLLGILVPQVFIAVLTKNLIHMIAKQKAKW